jgi:hypothetical protein
MPTYLTKYVVMRRDDCLHIDTSTPSVEGESIATPSAMSEQDERIWAQRYKEVCRSVFYRIAPNRAVKIGIFTRTEGRLSYKIQPNEIGRTSASAEASQTVPWRSRQRLHLEQKETAE